MEIYEAGNLKKRMQNGGENANVIQLFPMQSESGALIAVDLLEVEPGGNSAPASAAEEQVLFVISGSGELLSGAAGSPLGVLRAGIVAHIGAYESHSVRNSGPDLLRILVSTPLLVRSNRALGRAAEAQSVQPTAQAETPSQDAVSRVLPPAEAVAASAPRSQRIAERAVPVEPPAEEAAAPEVDISKLMKRGSDLVGTPRAEKPRREPEPEHVDAAEEGEQPEAEGQEEEAEPPSNLMELSVVFDGGSRGNPGQGYGSYLVQAPNRPPVVKRVEFGDNYTNNQAEYETLISALEYIIERLTATGRTAQGVQLQIKSDSDLVVNQILGNFKVKDAGMRKRHERAMALLEQFADWFIEWHERDESVRLLGH